MKTCPICKARCFDDMEICYGCLHRFDARPQAPASVSAASRQSEPRFEDIQVTEQLEPVTAVPHGSATAASAAAAAHPDEGPALVVALPAPVGERGGVADIVPRGEKAGQPAAHYRLVVDFCLVPVEEKEMSQRQPVAQAAPVERQPLAHADVPNERRRRKRRRKRSGGAAGQAAVPAAAAGTGAPTAAAGAGTSSAPTRGGAPTARGGRDGHGTRTS